MTMDPYKRYRDMMSVPSSPPLTRGRVEAVRDSIRLRDVYGDVAIREALRPPTATKFDVALDAQLKRIRDSLVAKNVAYGNSALEPVRVFSDVGPLEQLNVRIDDKISRMKSGLPDDEDAAWDLLGYLVLREVAKEWRP